MEDDVRKIEGCPIYVARGVLCPRLKFLCLCSPSTTSTRVRGTHCHKDTTAEMCPNGPEWMTIWPFVHSCEDTMSGLTGACATSHTPRLCFQALMIPANFWWQSPHCCITSLLRNMTKQTGRGQAWTNPKHTKYKNDKNILPQFIFRSTSTRLSRKNCNIRASAGDGVRWYLPNAIDLTDSITPPCLGVDWVGRLEHLKYDCEVDVAM